MRQRVIACFQRCALWFHTVAPGWRLRALRERIAVLEARNARLAAQVEAECARADELRAQRAYLDSMLDGIAPDVFFVLDHQARVIRCNDAFTTVFGWSRHEIIGESIARIFADPRELRQMWPHLSEELSAHGVAHFEHDFMTRAQRPVRLEIHLVHDRALRLSIVVGRDVTAQRQMERQMRQALATSERNRGELEAIFNTVQDALIVYDLRGQPLYVNQYAQQVFGAALTNSNIFQLDPQTRITTPDGNDVAPTDFPVAQVLRGVPPQGGAILQVRPPHRPMLSISVLAAPLRDAQGRMCGALLVVRDITEEQRNQRNAETLRMVAQACAGAATQTAVAEAALGALIAGLRLSNGAIIVHDSDRPGYACGLAFQFDPSLSREEQERWQHLVVETPISDQAPLQTLRVLATGAARCGNPLGQREGAARTLAETYRNGVIVPLHVEGAVFGALTFTAGPSGPRQWEAADRDFIRAVADQVATALHRAQLYEEARRLALYDPLTGLRNHRAMHNVLRQELGAGAAQGLPVSLIMLDIDHFRKFNEVYGHEVGDRALRDVAQAMQSVLRGGDYAARYGGEEFVIVLPATDADHAHAIAGEILARIQGVRVALDHARAARLTASLGHATFPLHASAPASLLKAADLALYAAKRAGRDQVAAYSPRLLEHAPLLPTATDGGDPGDITLPSGADLEMAQALITAIDLRDGYTAAHSDGVSRFAVAIAQSMRLPAEHVEALRLGGLIHDAGKIGVPDQILRKPGKLDAAEWTLMQAHTTMGEEILRPVEKLKHLLPLVRWHHERLDGSGYPDGLSGDQIPQLVRILSVADVFEAFTAERPYHPGRPAWEGLALLHDEARLGRLDGAIVAIFAEILRKQGLIDDLAHGEQDLQAAA